MKNPITIFYGPADGPRYWSDRELAKHKGKKMIRINLTNEVGGFHLTELQILKKCASPTSLVIFHVEMSNIEALLKLLTNHGRITLGNLSAHVIINTTDTESELELVAKVGHLEYVNTYSAHLAIDQS